MDSERKKLYAEVKRAVERKPAKFKCVGYRRGRPVYQYDRSGPWVRAAREFLGIMFGVRKL